MSDPRVDPEIDPPSAGLVDDDLTTRSWKGPVIIGAVAVVVSALLFFGLKQLPTPDPEAPKPSIVVEEFKVDDPKEPGYVAPALVGELKPDWPAGIGSSPYKGKVTVGLVVSPAGDVAECTIVRSLEPVLDGVARRTARGLKFRPATRNGAPSGARITLGSPSSPSDPAAGNLYERSRVQ
ncbi:MAG: TonB family protein [Acidobacteriota bacterium]